MPNAEARSSRAPSRACTSITDREDRCSRCPRALQYRYGVNRVFVVNGDRLAAREIKIGDRVGDRVEVVSGVAAGDRDRGRRTSRSWPTARIDT